jgi:hypothetical protein
MTPAQFWTSTALVAALAQGQDARQPQPQPQDPHQGHHGPAPEVVEGGWLKYHHDNARFSLEYPPEWRLVSGKGPGPIHIAHPTKAMHLFALAFTMDGGTLREFADQRFALQRELFAPIGAERTLDGVGWNGLVQEAEANGNGEQARRRMLCARHENLYVSLDLYVDPKELVASGVDYERLFTSLRFDAKDAAPGGKVVSEPR